MHEDLIIGGIYSDNESNVSVFQAACLLKSVLLCSKGTPEYIKNHLSATLKNVENELLALLCDKAVHNALSEGALSGQPGQLEVPKHLPQALKQCADLVERIEVYSLCPRLKSGLNTTKALSKIIKAHLVGDLPLFRKALDALLAMNDQPSSHFIRFEDSQRVNLVKNKDEVLQLADDQFLSLFTRKGGKLEGANNSSRRQTRMSIMSETPLLRSFLRSSSDNLSNNSGSRRMSVAYSQSFSLSLSNSSASTTQTSDVASTSDDLVVSLSSNSRSNSHVNSIANSASRSMSIDDDQSREWSTKSEIVSLREEVKAYLSLLEDHFIFESAYSDFVASIQSTPAAGLKFL